MFIDMNWNKYNNSHTFVSLRESNQSRIAIDVLYRRFVSFPIQKHCYQTNFEKTVCHCLGDDTKYTKFQCDSLNTLKIEWLELRKSFSWKMLLNNKNTPKNTSFQVKKMSIKTLLMLNRSYFDNRAALPNPRIDTPPKRREWRGIFF